MTTWDHGLVKVVNAASVAVSDPSQWDAMLDALGKRFDATASAIFARPAGPDASSPLATARNLPPDGMKAYLDQWVQHDPWLASARRSPMVSGNCYIGREVCDWKELDRSRFYNEFSKFQGVRGLLSLLVDDGLQPAHAPFTFLSVYRAPGLEEFSEDDRRAMRSIHAPVQTALRAYCALSASRNGRLAAAAALDAVGKPIFVLDRSGRLLHANVAADAGKVRSDWLVIRTGRLMQLVSTAVDAAPALVSRAAQGQLQTVRLWRPALAGGVHCAIARLVPLGEANPCAWAWPQAAVLLLLDEEVREVDAQRIPALSMRYRLTTAESQLLAQLGNGLDPADIASANGVSIHTVRTHIKHLFEKTGVSRQTDLVRLLAPPVSPN